MFQMLVHFSDGFAGAKMAAWLATRCFPGISADRSLQAAVLNSAYAGYRALESTMATCPRCGASLGLRTSFALANLWSMRGVPPFAYSPKLEFRCHRCGRVLTYRYELVGLFAVLALLPFMAWSALPSFGFGDWAYFAWPIAGLLYLAALAVVFSYFARPVPANPSMESDL